MAMMLKMNSSLPGPFVFDLKLILPITNQIRSEFDTDTSVCNIWFTSVVFLFILPKSIWSTTTNTGRVQIESF